MAPPAQAEFIRGPFDGLVIDIDQVDRFVADDAMRESYDNRLFLLMPPLVDWDRLVEGKADRDGRFDLPHPYEVCIRPGGLKFVYCDIGRYWDAMDDPRAS